MVWAAIGSVVAGAVVSSALAPDAPKSGAGSPAGAADPFAAQRGQYQTSLNDFMKAPGTQDRQQALQQGWEQKQQTLNQSPMAGIAGPSDPSYQWRFDQGQKALERSYASKGMGQSGNIMQALVDYGQGQASTEYGAEYARRTADNNQQYGRARDEFQSQNQMLSANDNNQYNRLAQLSGAGSGSPAAAGQLIAGQQSNDQNASTAFGGLVSRGVTGFMNRDSGGADTPIPSAGTTYDPYGKTSNIGSGMGSYMGDGNSGGSNSSNPFSAFISPRL